MTELIHPTAIIEEGAQLTCGVEVGAYSVIGANVKVGAQTKIGHHVVIEGDTTIGECNEIYHFSSIGGAPQDKKYAGEPTKLLIGNGNLIREYCTVNRGTVQADGITKMGDENWIMACAHIAHDCVVGDKTVIANSVALAGHVQLGDWSVVGGLSGIHQFVRIGSHCMIGGGTVVLKDIPDYLMANGAPCKTYGINSEGLKRRGFNRAQVERIRQAYKLIYRSGLLLSEAAKEIRNQSQRHEELAPLAQFLETAGRGIIR